MKVTKTLLMTLTLLGILLFIPSFSAFAKEEKIQEVSPKDWEQAGIINVKGTYLNMRNQPLDHGQIVGGLLLGDKVEILSKKDKWVEVKSGELQGFIHGDYILTQKEAFEYAIQEGMYQGMVQKDKALLYTTNEDNETVIETLDQGSSLVVSDYHGSILKVKLENGTQGIVKSEDLELYLVYETGVSTQELGQRLAKEKEKQRHNHGASPEDVALLAAIIQCEAGGEIYEGKIAVGAVIMNRLHSPVWPNTLREVIYQSGQFEPAMSGWLDQVLSEGARQDCIDAAIDVLNGANNIGEYYYFHAGSGAGLQIGNQTFH